MSKARRVAKSVPRNQQRLNNMMGNNTPPTTAPKMSGGVGVGESLADHDAAIRAAALREAAEIARARRAVALGLLGPVPMPFSMDETYMDLITHLEAAAKGGEK